jgi:hypothetical protein
MVMVFNVLGVMYVLQGSFVVAGKEIGLQVIVIKLST